MFSIPAKKVEAIHQGTGHVVDILHAEQDTEVSKSELVMERIHGQRLYEASSTVHSEL
jgi:hypothetical protein